MGISFKPGTGAVRRCGSAPRSRAFEEGSAPGSAGLAAVIAELAKRIAIVDPNSMAILYLFITSVHQARRAVISADPDTATDETRRPDPACGLQY